jgi:hypothetical protein
MKAVAIVAGVVVVVLGVGGGGIALFASLAKEHKARKQAAFLARSEPLLPKYLAHAKKIGADPFFTAPRPDADAGPYLNPRLGWDVAKDVTTRGELSLPEPVRKQVKDWDKRWTEHADDPVLQTLDFGWMRELSKYGHWNLVPGGPLEQVEDRYLETLPVPYYLDLITWAKLRFLRAHKTGDFVQASAEIRQLAWLSYSTELLLGAVVATAILSVERAAHEAEVAARSDVTGWTPYEAEWTSNLRSVVTAANAYTYPKLPERLVGPVGANAAVRCAAMTEMAGLLQLRQSIDVPPPDWISRELGHPPPPCRYELLRWLVDPQAPAATRTHAREQLRPVEGTELWLRLTFKLIPGVSLDTLEAFALSEIGIKELEKLPAAPP